MRPLSIAILVAALAGVASFLFLPPTWVLSLFGIGIAATLLFGIAVRVGTKPRKPVHPAVELALFAANLPPDPLAKAADGWPLWCFAAAAAYVVTLGLSMVVGGAYA